MSHAKLPLPRHPTTLLLALACLAPAALGAQSALERSPNLQGDWVTPFGNMAFVLSHRFLFLQGGDQLISVPTLTLAAGLPFGLAAGMDFTSFSEAIEGNSGGNETQYWLRRRMGTWEQGALAIQGAYNRAAGSWDGAVGARHELGALSLFGELRAFSKLFGTEDAGAAGGLGAALRLTPHLALTGDLGRVLTADTFGVVWSTGLAMEIPGSPHTLSFTVGNSGATTLQGASRPRSIEPEKLRYGFTFSVPLTPARFFSIFSRGSSAPPPLVGATVRVEMRNTAFIPQEVRIRAGETVEWINMDPVVHTVVSDDGSWGSPPMVETEAYRRTFSEPGRYTYYCGPHPQMRGVVIVEP